MAQLEVNNLCFTYPEGKKASLKDLSLTIHEGDFILLCGTTGSGKSTLLRHLKKETQPEGERTGTILYQGQPFTTLNSQRTVTDIGMVFQDPDNQLVMDTVSQELAFALENLNYSSADMFKRMGEMVQFFGIEDWLHSSIHELSGGQKQILNLAAVLLLQPKILLLDEPTSQLDPVAAKDFLQLIKRINDEFYTTIVLSEHRLTEAFPLANRVVLLEAGEVVLEDNPRAFIRQLWEKEHRQWQSYLPKLSRWYLQQQNPDTPILEQNIPLTVKEGRRWITQSDAYEARNDCNDCSDRNNREQQWQQAQPLTNQDLGDKCDEHAIGELKKREEHVLKCEEVFFQYSRTGRRILNGLNARIPSNEICAILGGNGTGKSTLLKTMLGLLRPQKGKIIFQDKPVLSITENHRYQKIGYLDQNPKLYFAYETVREVLYARAVQVQGTKQEKETEIEMGKVMGKEAEIEAGLQVKNRGAEAKAPFRFFSRWRANNGLWSSKDQAIDPTKIEETFIKEQIARVMEELQLSASCLEQHPYDLSGGEQQKLALALVLMAEPSLLLLDEPTKGLDPKIKATFGQLLRDFKQRQLSIVFVSHDVEFVEEYATQSSLLFDGRLTEGCPPQEFFSGNYFYTTPLYRLWRGNESSINMQDMKR